MRFWAMYGLREDHNNCLDNVVIGCLNIQSENGGTELGIIWIYGIPECYNCCVVLLRSFTDDIEYGFLVPHR